MAKDVVIYPGEIITALSEIENHIDALSANLLRYKRVLGDIQKNGVQDELIRGKIGNISILIEGYIKQLADISEEIKKNGNSGVNKIKTVDDSYDVSFIQTKLSEIGRLISMLN